MKAIQVIATLFFSLIFTNSKAEILTYDYFIQHPAELQAEMTRCTEGSHSDEAQCKIIKQAAADFLQLVEARAKDPEGFGTEIMNIQAALAKNSDVNSAEYKKLLQKLHTMYAVIAATSVE